MNVVPRTPPTDAPTGVARLALSLSLATIVKAAQRLPRGCSARRALADAARPLRDELSRTSGFAMPFVALVVHSFVS